MRFKNLCLFISIIPLVAQTTVNPDLTAIGDLQFAANPDSGRFSTTGIELAIQGYVNPYAYATAILHKPDGETPLDLEEGYLAINRGLPFGLGLKTGRFRVDLGHVNLEHEHTLPYIVPLQSAVTFLGDEMWSAVGTELNALLPLPWYSQLSLGYFAESPESPEHLFSEGPSLSVSWNHFFDLGASTHLEGGFSGLTTHTGNRTGLINTYFKMKWKPDSYRALVIQGEGFNAWENHARGGYIWANVRIRKVWNGGVIVETTQIPGRDSLRSLGLFAGFSPVEETTLFRLLIRRSTNRSPEVITQVLWTLGPHKPHQF